MSAATGGIEPTVGELRDGHELVRRALAEDLGPDCADLTAPATRGARFDGVVVARQPGVTCGLALACNAFAAAATGGADSVRVRQLVVDGRAVASGDVLLEVAGSASDILRAERVALNVVQRLAGTATLTRRYVDAVAGTGAAVLDTRKTIPGMRSLQRWAVRCGGGANHRFGLYDEAMVKDNHIAACGGSIADAVAAIRAAHPQVVVHVEADTLDQVTAAVAAGADVVLLDNMELPTLRAAVELVAGRCRTEASGGVTLETVRAIAESGVDRISVGAITHSAPAFDVALDGVGAPHA